MTLSSANTVGTPKTNFKEENPRLESSEIEPPALLNDAGLPLPPFKVFLKWLQYYHAQTGTWPEPEELAITTLPVPATGNRTTAIPDYSTANNTGSSNIVTGPTTEKPLLKFVTAKVTMEQTGDNLKTALDKAVSFDLKGSPYYLTALSLIEKHASINTLSEAATLTLGSLLAWGSHPIFYASYKEKGFGPGMYIPLEQWSKTLKMRKATLSACIKELESVGLIKTRLQTPAGTVKRGYMLAVPLYQTLPAFDPSEAEINWEPALEPKLESSQLTGTRPGPELATMTHEQNKFVSYEENNYELISQSMNKKIHDHGDLVELGTVEDKLSFLVDVASFPGYTSPEGLITLDKREALKFAEASQLDLISIKKIYHQTLSAWTSGKCTKNPIGFFHRSLSAHLSKGKSNLQMPSQPALAPVNNFPVKEVPGTRNSKVTGSRFPKQTVQPNSSQYRFEDGFVAANQGEQACTEISSTLPSNQTPLSLTEFFNLEHTVTALQTQTLTALQDRFKQPELAKILAQLNWTVSMMKGKLRVELENTGSKMGIIPVLGQSELSLLKIALSQRVRSLTAVGLVIEESFEIEIVVVGDHSTL